MNVSPLGWLFLVFEIPFSFLSVTFLQCCPPNPHGVVTFLLTLHPLCSLLIPSLTLSIFQCWPFAVFLTAFRQCLYVTHNPIMLQAQRLSLDQFHSLVSFLQCLLPIVTPLLCCETLSFITWTISVHSWMVSLLPGNFSPPLPLQAVLVYSSHLNISGS